MSLLSKKTCGHVDGKRRGWQFEKELSQVSLDLIFQSVSSAMLGFSTYNTTLIKIPEHTAPVWSAGGKHTKLSSRRLEAYLQLRCNDSDIQKLFKTMTLSLC